MLPLHVIKRNGTVAEFDLKSIRHGIRKAFLFDEDGEYRTARRNRLSQKEWDRVDGLLGFVYMRLVLQQSELLHVADIQSIVESVLLMMGETAAYRSMVMYQRRLERAAVPVADEVDWTPLVAGPAPAWRSLCQSDEAIALGVPEFDPEADADAALRAMAEWMCPWELMR